MHTFFNVRLYLCTLCLMLDYSSVRFVECWFLPMNTFFNVSLYHCTLDLMLDYAKARFL